MVREPSGIGGEELRDTLTSLFCRDIFPLADCQFHEDDKLVSNRPNLTSVGAQFKLEGARSAFKTIESMFPAHRKENTTHWSHGAREAID